MMVNAPTWGGAQQGAAAMFGRANRDAQMGWAARLAALQHEARQRAGLNAILRDLARTRAQKKAQQQKQGFLGLGGAAAGAGIGALLAAPTGGMSILAGAGLGGGIGALTGSAADQAMGRQSSASAYLGNNLLDFSTEFLDTIPNPYFTAAKEGSDLTGPQKTLLEASDGPKDAGQY